MSEQISFTKRSDFFLHEKIWSLGKFQMLFFPQSSIETNFICYICEKSSEKKKKTQSFVCFVTQPLISTLYRNLFSHSCYALDLTPPQKRLLYKMWHFSLDIYPFFSYYVSYKNELSEYNDGIFYLLQYYYHDMYYPLIVFPYSIFL